MEEMAWQVCGAHAFSISITRKAKHEDCAGPIVFLHGKY